MKHFRKILLLVNTEEKGVEKSKRKRKKGRKERKRHKKPSNFVEAICRMRKAGENWRRGWKVLISGFLPIRFLGSLPDHALPDRSIVRIGCLKYK
ncbi:hypothetical protein NPIL_245681 [Nephila pilipes]|uniref:Uncharacterized protein n=1 Tax=Nephila pilipes TaxID=299642 RepID=A0A8X6NYA0_NEPPI|nr:hypothetical protein NPIL_245681 [Nephila pilipes]